MGKTIAIIGTESVGKTTLAAALAKELQCPFIPEYARVYLEKKASLNLIEHEGEITEADIEPIVIGQLLQETLAINTTPLCVLDTTVIMSFIYAEHYFKQALPWVEKEILSKTYDYLFLLRPEFPFARDAQRGTQEDQYAIHRQLITFLKKHRISFYNAEGSVSERVHKICSIIER